jgi:hypothetical protein
MGRLVAIAIALVLGCSSAIAAPKHSSKIDPALIDLHTEHGVYATQQGGSPFTPGDGLIRVVNERVVIDAVADGDVFALQAALTSLGMQNVAVFGRVVSGELPIVAIPALDGIRTLRFVQPSVSILNVGAVTSQGDQAMRSNVARNTLGVTGAGVTVGVLSDSLNCKGGLSADITSGDLPPTVLVIQEEPGCSSGTDEGRAMLQIVHDVAPGASLAFATVSTGVAGFANNILALRANGAKVIVDDVIYPGEPMFQDGIIAQAVNTVVSEGAAYFSAAGNYARQSYESIFRAGTLFPFVFFPSAQGAPTFSGGIAHNFAPSGVADHFQSITIPTGNTLIITLQWDSSFFSASGVGSPNDVDIYLLNSAAVVVAGKALGNVGNDAVEVFSYRNFGLTADFHVMIVNYSGPLPGYIKYIQLGSPAITINEFDTQSSTLFGHANAFSAEAVGAAPWFSTPAFGVTPPALESFSSRGGTPILFDTAGNRLPSPVIRAKPEITAPDGGNTTFFGADIPQDPDIRPNFFGTSAAAPHAAGVAALLLEQQPSLSPFSIYAALERTAIDIGPPGFDFDSGVGLIDAFAALHGGTFDDVPPTHVFFRFIEALVAAGITSGCSVTPPLYCPDSSVTRGQMAVFLLRGIAYPGLATPPTPTGFLFADVPLVHPFVAWIEGLSGAGITGGCGTNPRRYCPDDSVTRAQMAVFLLKSRHGAGYVPPIPTEQTFADVPLNHPFATWIYQMAAEGITGGCAVNPLRYCPDSSVTRGQMAVFLDRTFNLPLTPIQAVQVVQH